MPAILARIIFMPLFIAQADLPSRMTRDVLSCLRGGWRAHGKALFLTD
jgi:hypothetical protein